MLNGWMMDEWVSRWINQQRWLKVVMKGGIDLKSKAEGRDTQLKRELCLGPVCRCS